MTDNNFFFYHIYELKNIVYNIKLK